MGPERTLVAESELSEQVQHVIVYHPNGDEIVVTREQLVMLELSGLALAWKDGSGKIHRSVGLPLEVVSVESHIIRPE